MQYMSGVACMLLSFLRSCGDMVVNVVDDVRDEGENNSADELATPRKPDKGRGVARMQAKLVMAAQNGRLRDWTKGALLNCLDVLGVKVAGNSNWRDRRDLAMHHGMPLCRTSTVSRVLWHHKAAPSPVARSQWMTWMDSSMNESMFTYLHVPFWCYVLSSNIFLIFRVGTFDVLWRTLTILFVDPNLIDADCDGHDAIP